MLGVLFLHVNHSQYKGVTSWLDLLSFSIFTALFEKSILIRVLLIKNRRLVTQRNNEHRHPTTAYAAYFFLYPRNQWRLCWIHRWSNQWYLYSEPNFNHSLEFWRKLKLTFFLFFFGKLSKLENHLVFSNFRLILFRRKAISGGNWNLKTYTITMYSLTIIEKN